MKRKTLFIIVAICVISLIWPQSINAVGQTCCKTQAKTLTQLYELCPFPQNLDGGSGSCLYKEILTPGSCNILDQARYYACIANLPSCGNNPYPFPWECDTSTEYCDSSTNKCVLKQQPIHPQTPRTGSICQNTGEISTAIGCIKTDPEQLIAQVLQIGIFTGSGVAFLLILLGTFKVLSSHGNPEGIGRGKEQITSAIIGLVFIIMSITILQIIGFDILGLGAAGLGTR